MLIFLLLTLLSSIAAAQPKSFWPSSTVPANVQSSDAGSVTLGMQFYSDVPGSITAVRFYKGTGNTGTHIGTLWSSIGAKLAEVTFSGETASGWQQKNFTTPITITANTPYVISYLAPNGRWPYTYQYPWLAQQAAPLHASNSSSGVYTYGSIPLFPTTTWNNTNYWVDLVFNPTAPPPPATYSISGNVSGSAAKVTLSGAASGNTNTDAAGNYIFSGLPNGSYVITPSVSFTPVNAPVTINGVANVQVNFTAAGAIPPTHKVDLTWVASTSPGVNGYNIYRSASSGGPYTKISGSGVSTTAYSDTTVVAGSTYYYVATAMVGSNESGYSNQAIAAVPAP